MARFDVHAHPVAAMRKTVPYLVDVQNDFINGLDSRIVIPMRPASSYRARLRDLNPVFEIRGKSVVLDTASMAAFPARELGPSIESLRGRHDEIVSAIDCLFGGF
ncbi:CcdB family protein [Variovorax sp. VNK109]|jgi:toxin CcdB|uniref:CcdB family protein n=1 Tax=Variovorax sp. VNK109 TaxID=3400919 RepID=UPI003C12334F